MYGKHITKLYGQHLFQLCQRVRTTELKLPGSLGDKLPTKALVKMSRIEYEDKLNPYYKSCLALQQTQLERGWAFMLFFLALP